jgi:leader peptidase (prepilin peptidase) / N-methyltransferase
MLETLKFSTEAIFPVLGYTFTFIIGNFIGSFLNVIADRTAKSVETGKRLSPFKGRSQCDDCGEKLGLKDLFPLLSFASLKGKCRYCKAKLSFFYPISEILTGLAFVGLAYYLNVFGLNTFMSWLSFAYLAIVISFMLVIFLADLKYQIIPNKVIFPAIAFVLLVMLISMGVLALGSYKQLSADPFGRYLLQTGYWESQMISMLKNFGLTLGTAGILAGFFWLLIIITKGKGMGGGDVKLAFLIGIVNGFPMNIVAIILGFVIGAVYSSILMVLGRKSLKDVIPFGPFLIIGSVLAFAFGQQLFDWYIGLI